MLLYTQLTAQHSRHTSVPMRCMFLRSFAPTGAFLTPPMSWPSLTPSIAQDLLFAGDTDNGGQKRGDNLPRQWLTRLYYMAHSPFNITWCYSPQATLPSQPLICATIIRLPLRLVVMPFARAFDYGATPCLDTSRALDSNVACCTYMSATVFLRGALATGLWGYDIAHANQRDGQTRPPDHIQRPPN